MIKSNLIITGASGLIGRHCIPLLSSDNYVIHAITNQELPKSDSNLIWHKCNLLDKDQIKALLNSLQANYLIHLAWYTKHKEFWNAPINLEWLEAGKVLVSTFLENKGKRIIIAGSCAEYEENAILCDEENTPCEPISLYGECKHSLHSFSKDIIRNYDAKLTWARIFNTYGIGENEERIVPSMIKAILHKNKFSLQHPNAKRDFLFLPDVANALVFLMNKDITGSVNICSGEYVTLLDLFKNIERLIGQTGIAQLEVNNTKDTKSLYAKSGKLFKDRAWKPTHDLQSGLKQSIDYYRNI